MRVVGDVLERLLVATCSSAIVVSESEKRDCRVRVGFNRTGCHPWKWRREGNLHHGGVLEGAERRHHRKLLVLGTGRNQATMNGNGGSAMAW
jgi:hypothetical protein